MISKVEKNVLMGFGLESNKVLLKNYNRIGKIPR